MKKTLKRILAVSFALVLLVGLTACGDKENSNGNETSDNNQQQEQGGSNTNDNSLKDVTNSNYKSITKNIFGLDVKDNAGWTLDKAESLNLSTNLDIYWKITNGDNAKSIIEYYFNQSENISKDGIYSAGYNEDYTKVIKGDKFDDFDTYYGSIAIDRGDFFQAVWIYDNNGKDVYFAINIEPKLERASLSFVLM